MSSVTDHQVSSCDSHVFAGSGGSVQQEADVVTTGSSEKVDTAGQQTPATRDDADIMAFQGAGMLNATASATAAGDQAEKSVVTASPDGLGSGGP